MKPQPAAKLKLFCFPYSGGSAQVYKDWGDLFPSSIEVNAIQYPGRGSRFVEPQITEMAPMVAEIRKALTPHLKMPMAFFGHSLGGGIALDLAKSLQVEGIALKHVFISARRAAHLPRIRKSLHTLPEAEFRKEVFELGGTSKEILEHPELMELVSPILRGDFSISEKYQFDPSVTLTCPLSAFGSEDDNLVEVEAISAWSQHTTGPFKEHIFPGGHFYLDTSRKELIAKILEHLAF